VKILVIGSDGQLGMEFQKISSFQNNILWFFSTTKDLDLSNLNSIVSFLDKISPSFIINCAAYTNVDKARNLYFNTF
jgi:dTDP-4-dehydrorhamnose reductase